MDCVVRTWIIGTISDDLAEAVVERGTTARTTWLGIESHFLGNRETQALFLDTTFRNFLLLSRGTHHHRLLPQAQGGMADALRDLG